MGTLLHTVSAVNKNQNNTSISMRGSILLCTALLLNPTSSIAQINFEDVSTQAGMLHPTESWGSGWGDFNGDGFPDLWNNNHRGDPTLYQNDGQGRFVDMIPSVWAGTKGTDTHGASWADFDNDGDMDVLEVSGGRNITKLNQLYVNENGVLVDKAEELGIHYPKHGGRGGLWLDYNLDGKLDVVSAGYPNVPDNTFATALFEQTSSGFVDVSDDLGFDCDKKAIFATLADISGDGVLDLICHGFAFPQKIYDISTTPFTDISSLVPQSGLTLDAALADFDGDLKTDVFAVRRGITISNAIKSSATDIQAHLWALPENAQGFDIEANGVFNFDITIPKLSRNEIHVGAGDYHPPLNPDSHLHRTTFSLSSDDPVAAGIMTPTPGQKGLFIGYDTTAGVWKVRLIGTWLWGVFSNERPIGEWSNIGFNPDNRDRTPKLFLHKANGFVDSTHASGLNLPLTCRPVVAGDFDNDMDVDLYVGCSHAPENLSNRLFENQGDGTFVEVPDAGGAAGTTQGANWNATVADYNVDGFLDIAVTNGRNILPVPSGPDELFKNSGNSNNWVQFDLVGEESNPHGIGARIVVEAGGKQQLREQSGGIHSYAQDFQRIHFGLGSNQALDRVTVRWPNGNSQIFANLAVNEVHQLVESSGGGGSTDDMCWKPKGYNSASKKGVYIWKNCHKSSLHFRVANGNDTTAMSINGNVVSDTSMKPIGRYKLEKGVDSLNRSNNDKRADFAMEVAGTDEDGIIFNLPEKAKSACLDIDYNGPVFIGLNGTAILPPVNLIDPDSPCS